MSPRFEPLTLPLAILAGFGYRCVHSLPVLLEGNMESLKRELKSWESQFKLLHDRRPTKSDLNSAPEDIREAYKRYHELKQGIKPQVQDQSAVFGKVLNKKKATATPLKTGVVLTEKCSEIWPPKLALEGQQHGGNDNPPKSISEKVQYCSKVGRTDLLVDEPVEATCSIAVNTASAGSFLSPLGIHSKINGVRSSRLKKKKSISLNWLDKVKCDPPLTDLPAPPNDHRESSDVRTVVQRQTELGTFEEEKLDIITQNKTEELFCGKKFTSKAWGGCDVENLPPGTSDCLKSSCPDETLSDERPVPRSVEESQRSSDPNATVDQEINCESHVDPANNHERVEVASHKKRKLDESIESAAVTKLPRLVKDEGSEGQNEKTGDASLSRGGSSGLVSNNFRRLDMKHRHYKRRGAGISGSSHKRHKWREMMKSREGGSRPSGRWGRGAAVGSNKKSDVCYKCGEEGHWAKNCRRHNRSKAKSRLEAERTSDFEEENCAEFPTIDEAAMMAVGIPLGQNGEAVEMHQRGQLVLPHELPRAGHLSDAPPAPVEPLYQSVDGQAIETPGDVIQALKKLGFSSFRAGQEETVMRILCGLSTLVVWSTGAGKSLCYQLPAFLYAKRSPCLTLVISPLVSLMEDQVSGLPFGLNGACLHTNMTKVQREKVTRDLCAGKLAVLLLSPEALVAGKGYLPAAAHLPPVAFACIDEAHCISEWSHNFRPSYLRVCKVLRERYGVRCFLGLTATATLSTAASAAQHLGIAAADHCAIVRGVTVPPNLKLSVSVDADRDMALVDLFRSEPFCRCDSVIIYCTRREETERVASMLRICLQNVPRSLEKGEESAEYTQSSKKKQRKSRTKRMKTGGLVQTWEVESYHAGMTAAQRRRVQKQFMSGELHVVVATVAFGMGLDKSDVRAIIHYNMPKTFEGYVQEIGRAGRDGLPAHCHVFLDPEGRDICELRRHVHANTVDRLTVKKLVKQVFPYCKCQELKKMQEERKECNMAVTALLEDDPDMNMAEEDCAPAGSDVTTSQPHHSESELNSCGDENGSTKSPDREAPETSLEPPNAPFNSTDFADKPDGNNRTGSGLEKEGGRCCGGHDVALIIDDLVDDLDMSEENILTLLCYLELHPNRLLQVLEPVKSTCTLKFYGGIAQMKKVAQKVPAVAAAAATISAESSSKTKSSNTLTFSAVKVADKMGWDLDPLRKELRALQWNTSLAAGTTDASLGQSGIVVEFSDMSLRVRAPGDFSAEERDRVCDFLEERIITEEQSQLNKLSAIYSILKHFASSQLQSDLELKGVIQSYFQDSAEQFGTRIGELGSGQGAVPQNKHVNWENIGRDIRAFVGIHRDHSFTGRNIARIFHGIESPCYRASVWGRERRFWRKHLDVDFNILRKFATQELLKLR